jgi:hypothetical protein
MTMPLDGGAPRELAGSLPNPELLVISSTNAYWVPFIGYQVFTTTLNGGARMVFFADQNFPQLAGIGIDNDNLYYTEESSGGPVGLVPLDGGPPSVMAHDNGTQGVVSDGTNVYFTSPYGGPTLDGLVGRVPVSGGATLTLVTHGWPEALAINRRSAFWTSSRAGTVTKITPR